VVDWAWLLGLLRGGGASLSNAFAYALRLLDALFGLMYDACMDVGFVTHELLHCCWEAVQCFAAHRIAQQRLRALC
jgi:hypothetical protein